MVILLLACTGKPVETGVSRETAEETGTPDTDTSVDTDDSDDTDTATETDTEDTDTDTAVFVDADGDGSPEGVDCDETNPYRHPGATEYCDTIDQDCDGEPLAAGSCALEGDPVAGAVWLLEQAREDDPGAMGLVTDLTGDGVRDLLGTGTAHYSFVPGGSRPAAPLRMPDEAWYTLWMDGPTYTGREAFDAGDVDGDGVGDLGVVSHGAGGISLFFGPFEEGREGYASSEDAFWRNWSEEYDGWGFDTVGGLDFDGDGRSDAVANPGDYVEDYDLDVYYGGEWEARCPVGAFGNTITGPRALGDLDGDGLDEISYSDATTPAVYLLSGGELRTGCWGARADVAYASMTTDRVDDLTNIGDWTGDGHPELMGGSPGSSSVGDQHGEIYFYSGTLTGEIGYDDALGSWVGANDGDNLGLLVTALDFDGDGTRDVFTNPERGGYAVLRGGDTPAMRSALPERILRMDQNTSLGDSVGDLDADGLEDLFVSALATEDIWLRGLYPGFEVPWDDDTWW